MQSQKRLLSFLTFLTLLTTVSVFDCISCGYDTDELHDVNSGMLLNCTKADLIKS